MQLQPMEIEIDKPGQPRPLPEQSKPLNGDDNEDVKSEGLAVKIVESIDPSLLVWNHPLVLSLLIMAVVSGVVLFLMIWKITDCTTTVVIDSAINQESWRTLHPHECVLYNTYLTATDDVDSDVATGYLVAGDLFVTSRIGQSCFPGGTPSFPSLITGQDTPWCTNDQKMSQRSLQGILENPKFKYKEGFEYYTQEWLEDYIETNPPCPQGEMLFSTSYLVCTDPLLAIGSAFGFTTIIKAVVTVVLITALPMLGCIKKIE